MKNKIIQRLHKLEKERNITILYAAEAGSRAWEMESIDSDYGIRFIYTRPLSWYLTIEKRRDIIEVREGNLDMAGWDLQKALYLFRKSNPSLMEWLYSHIVYFENEEFVDELKRLSLRYYSTGPAMYHYFHMAKSNFREYLKNDIVWLKKYLYVLRPILAIRYIEFYRGRPPVSTRELIDYTINDRSLRLDIIELLRRKRAGEELGSGYKIASISNFIEEELKRLGDQEFPKMKKEKSDELDTLLRRFIG